MTVIAMTRHHITDQMYYPLPADLCSPINQTNQRANQGAVVAKSRSGIQKLLIEWAKWRSVDRGANVYYSSVSPGPWVVRSGETPAIDDDMAARVDRAVSRLRARCGKGDNRWEALTDCYLMRKTDPVIARRLKVHRKAVMMARHAAENWVDAYIDAGIDGEQDSC